MDLNGTSAVVSGGASGLGEATARVLAAAGATVVIADLSENAGKQVADEIGGLFARTDVADEASVQAAVDAAAATGTPLRVAVSCAGIGWAARTVSRDGTPHDLASYQKVIAVNLIGTAAVVRAALPYLRSTGGRVVTCASTLGIKAVSDATAYCASKFGVVGFTRALAAELAGEVGVTLLIPGGMHTAFFDGRPDQYKPPADAKLNRPEDVAAAVAFLCSPGAGFITAHTLVVDGGLSV